MEREGILYYHVNPDGREEEKNSQRSVSDVKHGAASFICSIFSCLEKQPYNKPQKYTYFAIFFFLLHVLLLLVFVYWSGPYMDLRRKEISSKGTLKNQEQNRRQRWRSSSYRALDWVHLREREAKKKKTEDRKRVVVHSAELNRYCCSTTDNTAVLVGVTVYRQTLAKCWIYCIFLCVEVWLCTTRYHHFNSTIAQLLHLVYALNVLWCSACCPRACSPASRLGKP